MAPTFDIRTTPPFLAFRALREVATEAVGEASVLDLSQGEPGYGFSPSSRGRKFYSLFLVLDSALNDPFGPAELFASQKKENLPAIEATIRETVEKTFSPEQAQAFLADFEEVIEKCLECCRAQGMEYDRFDVLYEFFKYSTVTGGRYPLPDGQPIAQAVAAEEYSRNLGRKVYHHELIPVMGASHGIGAVFKSLGSEATGFLTEGDSVMMTSPVYAPYNAIFTKRKIEVLSLAINPEDGTFDPKEVEKLKASKQRIKAIILIEPNNPTGFPGSKELFEAMLDIAEAHNSLIITDEVYYRFFENPMSILHLPGADRRTIRIDSLSKIERSTGLRVGDVYISDVANTFISSNILQNYLEGWDDFRTLVKFAKSPGGINVGLFQHITGIPGPSVMLATAHLLLGQEEREKTVISIVEKMKAFYEVLGLPYKGNRYYGMFDCKHLEVPELADTPIEEKLTAIARHGVVLMPANLFFTSDQRAQKDYSSFVRVSLPNLTLENTKRAAQTVRDVLGGKLA